MFSIDDWVKEMSRLSDAVGRLDLGFPLGNNSLASPCDRAVVNELVRVLSISSNSQLAEFYGHCNGVSLPDVSNGFFIHSAEMVISGSTKGEPTRMLLLHSEEAIVVFGTDGGGGRFALKQSSGEVYYLPVGRVRDSKYDGNPAGIQRLTSDFFGFLDWLKGATEQFVQDQTD